jgi:archaellum biogenesis protein FlaJ (TadC family)
MEELKNLILNLEKEDALYYIKFDSIKEFFNRKRNEIFKALKFNNFKNILVAGEDVEEFLEREPLFKFDKKNNLFSMFIKERFEDKIKEELVFNF